MPKLLYLLKCTVIKYYTKNARLITIKYCKKKKIKSRKTWPFLQQKLVKISCQRAMELGHWNLNPFLKLEGLCLILSSVFWSGISMVFTVILNILIYYCKLVRLNQMETHTPFPSFLSLQFPTVSLVFAEKKPKYAWNRNLEKICRFVVVVALTTCHEAF